MGLKETVLGEVEDERLSVSAVVRRVLQRHALADWQPLSIEITVRGLKREGLLRAVEGLNEDGDDPVPLELTPKGRRRLRRWNRRALRPPAVREDLLLQIAGAEETDLQDLEAKVRARLVSVLTLAEATDGQQVSPRLGAAMPWRERRMLAARALDLGVLDGFARGLRRALAEIADARKHGPIG